MLYLRIEVKGGEKHARRITRPINPNNCLVRKCIIHFTGIIIGPPASNEGIEMLHEWGKDFQGII